MSPASSKKYSYQSTYSALGSDKTRRWLARGKISLGSNLRFAVSFRHADPMHRRGEFSFQVYIRPKNCTPQAPSSTSSGGNLNQQISLSRSGLHDVLKTKFLLNRWQRKYFTAKQTISSPIPRYNKRFRFY